LEFIRNGAGSRSAAERAVALLAEKTGAAGGLIIIDRKGRIGYDRNTTHMPVCFIGNDGLSETDS